jgi:outer membrane protein X
VKKIILAVSAAAQLFAGGDISAPVDTMEPIVETIEHEVSMEESRYYIVVSGMVLLGDEVRHGEALLDGNDNYGYGFGIDIGYRLGNGFALEYDFTYGRNDTKEITNTETNTAKARYYTSALDLVYTYEATEKLGIFGKVGYEYEIEKINAFGIDDEDHDFVFGAGIEYKLNETYKAVVEYEHSMIEGPHGDSILAGVMFNF